MTLALVLNQPRNIPEVFVLKKLTIALSLSFVGSLAHADSPDIANWESVVEEARGQTVYFNAWGGAENINAYLEWVGEELRDCCEIELAHVKLDDTANAVAKVVAERAAGRDQGGSVDLIWINGENFASMKERGLLLEKGWAEKLPNWLFVDIANKPTVLTDFTIPVEGQAAPWGMAKLVFFYDSARLEEVSLPSSADELLDWAEANPGRFSYPSPPDFIGSSFLKQVLIETVGDPTVLQQPADEADFDTASAPLFDYLDRLHKVAWREGRAFPQNYPAMKQLLADGELEIIFAFNPSEASNAIANFELPDTVRSFTFEEGTLGNTHFVAIPYNASAKAGALVTANFLMSPEAQLRKQDPEVWGDPTVLGMDKLPETLQADFAALDLGIATLAPEELGPVLEEPHPSWMERVEEAWKRRYTVGN
ncbi:ABC transporter substrate-binding protein [Nitratireductor basaltis]|uniref:ABC transporter substrate-binding protein n=1 Tax=Nitratireductor basaltis TaxID=472175 RepID=A0A084UEK6_9HYPH|nr:ABC transporter substrate-binding protein [Nitratireductor basaltis]KFB11392.1 hypothetical protein EL18_02440 [Nitratireductor basaltis]